MEIVGIPSAAPVEPGRVRGIVCEQLELVVPVQLHTFVIETHLRGQIAGMAIRALYRAGASPAAPLYRVHYLDRHATANVL
jgi:hypothetical protein